VISRVAGQRELAPPSNFGKEGGFNKSVFNFASKAQLYEQVFSSEHISTLRANHQTTEQANAFEALEAHLAVSTD